MSDHRTEGQCLPLKCIPALCQNGILCLLHGAKLLVRQIQKLLQRKLLINGIRSIQRPAVGSLHAVNSGAKILMQRMLVQKVQIVQADIGAELELQNNVIVPDCPQKLFPLLGTQAAGIQSVSDAHLRHLLSGSKCILYTLYAVCDIIPQAVILPCVHPDHKVRITSCDLYNFLKCRRQLLNVIDFFSDKVAACHIRVLHHRIQNRQILHQIIRRCYAVLHDRQRDSAHCRKEADQHAGLLQNLRHHLVHLFQHMKRLILLHQRGIADLHILNSLPLILPGNPQKLILKNGILRVVRIFPVPDHLLQCNAHVLVRNSGNILQTNLLCALFSLCKNIAVQIYLFQIRKHCLSILQNRQ